MQLPADVGGGVTFRQAVVAYVNPDSEGFNKYNSVRVDEFYNKLKATNNTMRLGAAEVKP